MKNLILIGMMGSFKSSAGKLVALKTGRPFWDTDDVLTELFGMSIGKYFEIYGEPSFREKEAEVCARIAKESGCIIATGGGVVLRDDNMTALKENALTIYLSATAKSLVARLNQGKGRPLLDGPDFEKKVEEILSERTALYEKYADHIIVNDGLTSSETADKIIELIKQYDK